LGKTRRDAPASTAAFAALLQQTQQPLYGYLRGLLADAEQARDVRQDVFCDAWRVAQKGAPPFDEDSDEQAKRRWLFQVAHHKAVSALRRRKLIRWESLDMPGAREQEETQAAGSFEEQIAEGEAVRAALASLSMDEASCLLLNIVQGFTSAEIAQIIGISPEASKKRLSRARQRLRAAYFAQDARREESPSP
jgi:RNA polymerase sigma factor (sigma-70 family)